MQDQRRREEGEGREEGTRSVRGHIPGLGIAWVEDMRVIIGVNGGYVVMVM